MDSFWEELLDLPMWLKLTVMLTFVGAIIAIEISNEYTGTFINNTISKLLTI